MAGKFSEKFEDVLILIAEKVDDNKYLQAIKGAFTVYMPFIIVGSFATLFTALVSSTKTGLAQWIPILEHLTPAFKAMNFATMTFMTVPIVFLIAMQLAKHDKIPEYITGVAAVVGYVSVIPSFIEVNGKQIAAVPNTALGAQGLFIGMLAAISVTELFKKLITIEKLKIKMPASVPSAIATSFN